MAKFYGEIGYAETVETSPGVWEEDIVYKKCYGDVIRNNRKLETSDYLNDDIVLNNTISIVADAYAYDHYFAIKCVKWMGGLWKVNTIEINRPRLILTLGGIYNGPESGSSKDIC